MDSVSKNIARREHQYGLPPGDFLRRLDVQGFRCADCLRPFESASSAQYDHDHKCCPGKRSCGRCVRGLVCNDCNWLRGVADSAGCNYVVLDRIANLVDAAGSSIFHRASENLKSHAEARGLGNPIFEDSATRMSDHLKDAWENAVAELLREQS